MITGNERTVEINIPLLSKYWSSANNLRGHCRVRWNEKILQSLTAIFQRRVDWYIPQNKCKKLEKQRNLVEDLFSYDSFDVRRPRKIKIWIFKCPRVKMMINKQMTWKPHNAINHGSDQLIFENEYDSILLCSIDRLLPSVEIANNCWWMLSQWMMDASVFFCFWKIFFNEKQNRYLFFICFDSNVFIWIQEINDR